jgi:LacI family transcriptional regulator
VGIRIKDIARLANVSTGTIDRVIHNRSEVSESTRKRVKNILIELNYQPDILASTLATKKNHIFSVLMPIADNGNEFWSAPMNGINKALNEIDPFGIEVNKFFFDQYDRNSFAGKAFDLLSEPCHGVLFAPVFIEESKKFINECYKKNIPVVIFN